MSECAIFDDILSWLHTTIGVATKMLTIIGYQYVAWLLFTIFMIYETVEDYFVGEEGRAKCDILEYIIGYILADILAPDIH